MHIVLADVETTGVRVADKICELAWIHVDENLEILDQDSALINPEMHIPSGASAVNGITDMMVVNAPTIDEYIANVGNPFMFSDLVFIAHNAPFDQRFLKKHIHSDATQLCTLRLARHLFPNADSHKQAALAIALGIEVDRSSVHSAGGDLSILLQLLRIICNEAECGIEGLIKLDAELRLDPVVPFGKHKGATVSKLPTDYARWMLTLPDLDDELKGAITKRLKGL